ncbi:hypothetical protein PENSPDRAFT_282747 [Peniophora sp. CONT]|nr:hypothetical protein PENSPDRAFT_282747 [Peniophora sp. CONT]
MDDISIKDIWSSLVESHFDVSHRGVSSPETRTRLSSLDTELVSMNRAMIVAKQRRNMLTGACHVPPEVLSTVFALAQKGWYPLTRWRTDNPGYDYGWINITHVCGYWREVSHSSSSPEM